MTTPSSTLDPAMTSERRLHTRLLGEVDTDVPEPDDNAVFDA